MENPFRIIGSLPAFGAYWVSCFLAAMLAMFAGNFVFHLALPDIVDGELAIHLVVMAMAEAVFLGLTLFNLVRGDVVRALRFASQIVVYLLNIFPALLAYDLYAGSRGIALVGHTRIYDWVLNLTDALLGLGGHRLVLGLNRMMSVNRQLAEPTVEGLRAVAIGISLLLAVLSLVQLGRRIVQPSRGVGASASAHGET